MKKYTEEFGEVTVLKAFDEYFFYFLLSKASKSLIH